MPRRTLLSSEQRTRLLAIPIDPAEMARHYVLSTEDLTVIRAKRRTVNRLGFAIQLCLPGILAKACDLTSTRQRR
jgi:TnpA family transposase